MRLRPSGSLRPARPVPSDVSSASSGSETDVSVSSSASSLAHRPQVAKRGVGPKSRSNTSVKSAQSKGAGLRRSPRLAKKPKVADLYTREIVHGEPQGRAGNGKRKVSTRSPKKHAPAADHRRSTGGKKHSSRPRK